MEIDYYEQVIEKRKPLNKGKLKAEKPVELAPPPPLPPAPKAPVKESTDEKVHKLSIRYDTLFKWIMVLSILISFLLGVVTGGVIQ